MLTRAKAKRIKSTEDSASNRASAETIDMPDNNDNSNLPATVNALDEQLRVERERIWRQRMEWEGLRLRLVDELRASTEAQEQQAIEIRRLRDEVEQLQNNSNESGAGNQNAGMLNGLVHGIHLMNLNIKPPRFGNDLLANPNEFLELVEKYFRIKKVQEDCQLLVLETLLEGRARDWYRAQNNVFADYASFKTGFLEEFYSVATQVRLKAQWSSRRYAMGDGTMQSYFLRQASVAQYFSPKLDQYEINYSVVQQLPMRARDVLVTVDYAATNVVARALAQLDASYEENRNRESRRSPPQNAPSNNSSFNGSPNTTVSSGVSPYASSSPNMSGNY